jgi:enoyl-CoA hydratase/carnithine racemase
MSETTLVNYSTNEGVAIIELCNPPANAYSYEMFRQVDDAILKARFDDEVHVLLLRGAGEKFFCAGADISMLDGVTPAFKYQFCLHANETLLRLEHTSKLVIAAIHGHCVGGGLEVAMAADIRIAKAGKGKIGLPEAKLGVLPGTGGTQRLSRLVGKSKSIEMMIENAMMSVEEAAQVGLVNKVFEGDDFWAQVMSYAKSFCPPGKASKAVGYIKRAVQSGQDLPLESGLALERELQQQLFQSDDAKEGIAAFVNKRDAVFTGR